VGRDRICLLTLIVLQFERIHPVAFKSVTCLRFALLRDDKVAVLATAHVDATLRPAWPLTRRVAIHRGALVDWEVSVRIELAGVKCEHVLITRYKSEELATRLVEVKSFD
jgi:hypothetical protein